MIKEAIMKLVSGKALSFEEAVGAMENIMNGDATEAQIGSFITALRIKGETDEEIAGLASVMRSKATPVDVPGPTIDVVGTGGDGSNSFNISTAAAFVAAGAGLKVAKHGNRAASSWCGSADILEALGVKLELSPEAVIQCIEEAGIGFMFAPIYHPAMKYAAAPRKEIGIRTVFNILGPLTNPAKAEHMVLGVPSEELGHKITTVLYRLGTKHSLVVYALEGMDELSISGASRIWEINKDGVKPPYEVTPQDFGLKTHDALSIKGGSPEENAAKLSRIFNGEEGALRDVVVMNAAAALVAGDIANDLKKAARLAEEIIDSGRAKERLNMLVEVSQRLG
jgi:anthranilate phosphoribosyltransferase